MRAREVGAGAERYQTGSHSSHMYPHDLFSLDGTPVGLLHEQVDGQSRLEDSFARALPSPGTIEESDWLPNGQNGERLSGDEQIDRRRPSAGIQLLFWADIGLWHFIRLLRGWKGRGSPPLVAVWRKGGAVRKRGLVGLCQATARTERRRKFLTNVSIQRGRQRLSTQCSSRGQSVSEEQTPFSCG